MTEVIYEKQKSFTELTVFGHCNAGRINGFDLCCCAVSMLIFTMLDTLGKLRLKGYRHSYGGGWCHVKFSGISPDIKKAKTVVETIMNGFELLEKRYPSSVKLVTKDEVNKDE